jgi:hypothetical protein
MWRLIAAVAAAIGQISQQTQPATCESLEKVNHFNGMICPRKAITRPSRGEIKLPHQRLRLAHGDFPVELGQYEGNSR